MVSGFAEATAGVLIALNCFGFQIESIIGMTHPKLGGVVSKNS
jgi:hypothetical protein